MLYQIIIDYDLTLYSVIYSALHVLTGQKLVATLLLFSFTYSVY
jgi:hypothetical protein